MADRLMRPGLDYRWGMDCAALFKRVDETGGWPIGYQFIGFEHTDEREAGFCNTSTNTGWWTVVASADDYYLWKLGPAALQRIVDDVLGAARITRVDAGRLSFHGWRGIVPTQKATGTQADSGVAG